MLKQFESVFGTAETEEKDYDEDYVLEFFLMAGVQEHFVYSFDLLEHIFLTSIESHQADKLSHGVIVGIPDFPENLEGEFINRLVLPFVLLALHILLFVIGNLGQPLLGDGAVFPEFQFVAGNVLSEEVGLLGTEGANSMRVLHHAQLVHVALCLSTVFAHRTEAPLALMLVVHGKDAEGLVTQLTGLGDPTLGRRLEFLEYSGAHSLGILICLSNNIIGDFIFLSPRELDNGEF